jgi:hypothetical protein
MKGKKITIVIGIVLLATFLPMTQADVPLKQYQESNPFTTYEYPSHTELVITFHLQGLQESVVSTERGEFTLLTIPDAGFIGAIGGPQVPALTQIYAVPTEHLSFEVVSSHLMETRYIEQLYPMQNPQPDSGTGTSPFVYNEAAYHQDEMVPGNLAELSNSGTIRDIPFVQLRFSPVQYNPAQHTASIYDTIIVKLTFSSNGPVLVEPGYTQKPFYPYYQTVFHNWQGFTANTLFQQQAGTKDPGCDYLIITHQNFYSQAKDLADWKHRTGFLTKVVNVTDIGSTYQQIRSYLQNAYASWDPRPSYVLLIGDANLVPTTYMNGVPTDLWYAAVNGSDYFPDLCIGRMPADTPAEATVMIQKTLTYEQTPPMLPSFYQNFTVAAYFQDDNQNGYEDRRFVLTSEEVRDYLLSQGYSGQRVYYTESYNNPTHYNNDYYANGEPLPPELLRPTFPWDGDATDIANALQNGIFILNHRDHGMETGWGEPAFTIADFNSFHNGDLLPVVFSLNCLTGKFDTGECFCEAFLKKADGGCVAIYGATDVSYSGYNDYLCRGMYDAMWPMFDTEQGTNISLHHLGEMLNYGKVYMTNTWGDPWGEEEYTFELFHCFGDPALDMYTALPAMMTTSVVQLPDSLQITVEGDGNPLAGACVCLTQENGFYASGITDANGVVTFEKTGMSIDEPVMLGAIAHNYLYHNESIMLNQRPEKPGQPIGPNQGKPNTNYLFKASTTDPDGDTLFYNFSWGDGTYSDWIGPCNSGAVATTQHAWAKKGTFNVTVKARDDKGQESDWSDPFSVIMPYKFSHPILQWLYTWMLHWFPFLATLLEPLL